MPRTAEEKAQNARKYGRRHAVLQSEQSANDFAAMTKRLLAELTTAGASVDRMKSLREALRAASDITRRRAAVWAIVNELEQIDLRRRR